MNDPLNTTNGAGILKSAYPVENELKEALKRRKIKMQAEQDIKEQDDV